MDESFLKLSGGAGNRKKTQKRNTEKKAQLMQVKDSSVKDLLLRKLRDYRKNKSKKTKGWNKGTCTVEKILMRLVARSKADAQVVVSSDVPRKLVSPPNPRQRDTGKRYSKSYCSAASAIASLEA